MKTTISIFACLIPGVLMAQDTGYEKAEFREGKEMLPYRLLRPLAVKKDQKYPLVVFLHGTGERGTNNTTRP